MPAPPACLWPEPHMQQVALASKGPSDTGRYLRPRKGCLGTVFPQGGLGVCGLPWAVLGAGCPSPPTAVLPASLALTLAHCARWQWCQHRCFVSFQRWSQWLHRRGQGLLGRFPSLKPPFWHRGAAREGARERSVNGRRARGPRGLPGLVGTPHLPSFVLSPIEPSATGERGRPSPGTPGGRWPPLAGKWGQVAPCGPL